MFHNSDNYNFSHKCNSCFQLQSILTYYPTVCSIFRSFLPFEKFSLKRSMMHNEMIIFCTHSICSYSKYFNYFVKFLTFEATLRPSLAGDSSPSQRKLEASAGHSSGLSRLFCQGSLQGTQHCPQRPHYLYLSLEGSMMRLWTSWILLILMIMNSGMKKRI